MARVGMARVGMARVGAGNDKGCTGPSRTYAEVSGGYSARGRVVDSNFRTKRDADSRLKQCVRTATAQGKDGSTLARDLSLEARMPRVKLWPGEGVAMGGGAWPAGEQVCNGLGSAQKQG